MRRKRTTEARRAMPGWKKRTGEWTHESGARVKRGLHGWIAFLPSGENLSRRAPGYPYPEVTRKFSTARDAAEAVLAQS